MKKTNKKNKMKQIKKDEKNGTRFRFSSGASPHV